MAIRICNVTDIKPGRAIRVKIGEKAYAIVHSPDGSFHALDDKCSHGEVSLSEGFVDNETIECWAHGAKFSLESGKPLSLPAYEPVSVYEVLVENGEVFLEVDESE